MAELHVLRVSGRITIIIECCIPALADVIPYRPYAALVAPSGLALRDLRPPS